MHFKTRTLLGFFGVAVVAATVIFVSPQIGQSASSRVLSPAGDKLFGTPFTQEIPVTIPVGSLNANGTAFTVPANHTLQIEFISVSVQTEPGTSPNTLFALNTVLNGSPHSHRLHMTRQGFTSGGEIFVAGQNVTIYADGGSAVNANVARDGNNSFVATATVTVTGRLFEN